MHQERPLTRRRFLKTTGAVTGGSLVASLPASSRPNVQGANEFLRLGFLGVGDRGSNLLRHTLNCISVSTLRVTAICDIDPKRRDAAVEKCGGMQPAGIHDYRELLDRKDVDAVVIATPIHLHAEHAVAALAAGKHCYCEKPLGPTPEDVKTIHEAVKKSGKRFQVGFQWRYHSGFLALADVVQSGGIGKVNFVTAARHTASYPTSGWYIDRKLSGDLIVEQAVHEMNVFCWVLKSHPLRATGVGGTNALKGTPPERTIMDHYSVAYEFPNEITLQYSHCIYTPNGLGGLHQTFLGTDGRGARLENTTRLTVSKDGKAQAKDIPLPPEEDPTELAIQSFVQCIRQDKEPLANIEAGRVATLMAILGRTAIQKRRQVEWEELTL